MKTIVIAFCFLCATAAFGQTASVISNNPQPTVLPDHPWHASQHSMATDSNLRGSADYSYEHGEQPLWEFGPVKEEKSLGEVARDYRKIHLAERKATVVMDK
ncbi:MAG TPA: hypothetical protein VK722_19790 [Candidatus Aquilonibacter sp.]|nr:hypothetical protein [Candidatus Aquilonibacter sp.]